MARIAYKINRKNKLAAASALSKLRPGYVQENFKKWYNRNKTSKQLEARRYSKLMYSQNPLLKKRKRESTQELIIVKIQSQLNKGQGDIQL